MINAPATIMKIIDSFSGENHFLSNFYPCKVYLDGVEYPSVENAYQAAKTLVKQERVAFEDCTAAEAKKLGKKLSLRNDWSNVKVPVMEVLLKQKFHDPALAEKLLCTGSAELVEGNWWGDTFWGVCRGQGRNQLGILLMGIRRELEWGIF